MRKVKKTGDVDPTPIIQCVLTNSRSTAVAGNKKKPDAIGTATECLTTLRQLLAFVVTRLVEVLFSPTRRRRQTDNRSDSDFVSKKRRRELIDSAPLLPPRTDQNQRNIISAVDFLGGPLFIDINSNDIIFFKTFFFSLVYLRGRDVGGYFFQSVNLRPPVRKKNV